MTPKAFPGAQSFCDGSTGPPPVPPEPVQAPEPPEPAVAPLLKALDAAAKKTNELEDQLHNPTAEVVYDILAMRGGTRLYSRMVPVGMWAMEAEGPPTAGMTQVLDEQEKELAALEGQVRAFLTGDVAALNGEASKLGLAFVIY